jgi:hypothetical protein
MAGQEINQYAIERLELQNDDYFDIDYYDTGLGVYKTAKIKGSVIKSANGGIFSQTSYGPVYQNSIAETSLLGTGSGTLLIPSNSWIVGQAYNFQITGTLTSLVNESINIRLKSGTTQLLSGGATTFFAITGGKYFEYNLTFICRAVGGAGVGILEGTGTFGRKVDTGSQYRVTGLGNTNNTTFDSTGNITLDITGEWSLADAANRIQVKTANLKRIF